MTSFGAAPLGVVLPPLEQRAAACADPSHDHSHDGAHSRAPAAAQEKACAEPACTDPSHDHARASEGCADASCADTACTDPTHDHSHDGAAASCADTACTDPTHDHSRDRKAEAPLFDSFVYQARRPFQSDRLLALIGAWPLPHTGQRPNESGLI